MEDPPKNIKPRHFRTKALGTVSIRTPKEHHKNISQFFSNFTFHLLVFVESSSCNKPNESIYSDGNYHALLYVFRRTYGFFKYVKSIFTN